MWCVACLAGLPLDKKIGGRVVKAGSFVNKFTRPLARRWIAGVCAGLAIQLGIDVTVFRIIAVFTAPVSIWIYILLWAFTGSNSDNRSF